ncbi:intradiol ring-cleavage dioxygenase [Rhizobium puerariae]|uniref:Intradiol ring-cleavage dioxygenase n=1 Tax=Rhizobium puerariae TaxID=1585791 RepID=A0ABV6ANI8_9HYPH
MARIALSRRTVLIASLFAPVLASADEHAANALRRPAPTPECDDDDMTPEQSAGPYYKPSSPLKDDFTADASEGRPFLLGGTISDSACKPMSGCMIEFWQADQRGNYDNHGFRLRGHQFTDAEGRYMLQTIWPGLYPGRTRHIHVRIRPASGHLLTTQVYFPDEPRNRSDFLFRPELLIQFNEEARAGRFDFVV